MAWPLIIVGMMMGLALILMQVKSPMLVSVGMYLPLETTFAIFLGGCVKGIVDMIAEKRGLNAAQKVRTENSGVLVAAGACMVLPQVANAVSVTESEVTITTPDGQADAYFVRPATGTAPGVLVWPDIFGLRPAFRQMGKRLAESGYSVLVVNPFYRAKKAPTAANGATTPIPDLMPLAQGLNETTHMTDSKAFVAWLDSQPSVAKDKKIGTQGYCMGGPIAFRTASAMPDRVGAVASRYASHDMSHAAHFGELGDVWMLVYRAVVCNRCKIQRSTRW